MITLTFPDGAKREIQQGLSAAQVAAGISKSLEKKAVAAVVNGVLVDLNDPITADATLQIVTRDDGRALELIRHDCAHVLAEAVQELYPGTQVTIGPVIENGFFYDFFRNEPFTPEDFAPIEKKMREIIQRDRPFTKSVKTRDEAKAFFRARGENFKVELVDAIPEGDRSLITTLAGALTGMIAAKRVIRPLGDAAQAAKAIAGGRLDTRLENTDDHDLQLLSTAFNDMAEALQNRVERDARFASDVSHELRSPLMTLAASVEVMQARRDEMPERAQAALDLLVGDVARFQGLVEDLLEISRFDAGAIRLHLEDLLVAEFVRQAVAVSSMPRTKLTVSDRAEGLIMHGDRRRLARVVANLIDNARVHGGGASEISVTEAEGEGEPLAHVWIVVEDHGPGVPHEERNLVFERFARGAVAGRRSSSDGAGLGLSLVDEHVRMHGGRVWVEDRADGTPGARFVLELPAEEVGVG